MRGVSLTLRVFFGVNLIRVSTRLGSLYSYSTAPVLVVWAVSNMAVAAVHIDLLPGCIVEINMRDLRETA